MGHRLPVLQEQPLSDGLDRRISYLRVSVTDRCNFRCTYCMPEEGVATVPRTALLDFEELTRMVSVFASLGVRRVRLTGGEPTVRRGIVDLTRQLAAVPGIDELVMTSNARLLGVLAEPLARAGLGAVNISLDTLRQDRFRALTRRDDLPAVLAGIDASVQAGLRVKINAVALAGINDDELSDLCAFAWERGLVPRFIEHMPMSAGEVYSIAGHLPAATIRRTIFERFGELEMAESAPHRGPARYWRTQAGTFGIISAMSEHFCDTCNRLRLSATGQLHTCLGYDDATDLREPLRAGATDSELRDRIRAAVLGKRAGHRFDLEGGGGPNKHMISIGG